MNAAVIGLTCITTVTGHVVDIAQPGPCDALNIEAIAHSLALQNRYVGHTRRPYSVAEHSLRVCEIAERELGLDGHGQLAALLHDAHEMVVGDCSTPLKHALGTSWAEVEAGWQYAVQRAFAIVTPSIVNARAIKRADLIALATERRDLLTPTAGAWPQLDGVEPWRGVSSLSGDSGLTWQDWRDIFIERFHELEWWRNERIGILRRGPIAAQVLA